MSSCTPDALRPLRGDVRRAERSPDRGCARRAGPRACPGTPGARRSRRRRRAGASRCARGALAVTLPATPLMPTRAAATDRATPAWPEVRVAGGVGGAVRVDGVPAIEATRLFRSMVPRRPGRARRRRGARRRAARPRPPPPDRSRARRPSPSRRARRRSWAACLASAPCLERASRESRPAGGRRPPQRQPVGRPVGATSTLHGRAARRPAQACAARARRPRAPAQAVRRDAPWSTWRRPSGQPARNGSVVATSSLSSPAAPAIGDGRVRLEMRLALNRLRRLAVAGRPIVPRREVRPDLAEPDLVPARRLLLRSAAVAAGPAREVELAVAQRARVHPGVLRLDLRQIDRVMHQRERGRSEPQRAMRTAGRARRRRARRRAHQRVRQIAIDEPM